MNALLSRPRDAAGPPGGFGQFLNSVLAGTTAQTTSSTTSSTTTSESSSTTSSISTESSVEATSTSKTSADSTSAQAVTAINTGTSTSSNAATTTPGTSDDILTTGSKVSSTSILGASYIQASSESSSVTLGPAVAAGETQINSIKHAHHSGLSAGAIAAAVVVPIILALLALLLAFLCLRRRARSSLPRTGSDLGLMGTATEKSAVPESHQRSIPMGASNEIPPTRDANEIRAVSANDQADIPGIASLGPLAAPLVSRYSAAWDDDHRIGAPEDTSAHRSPFADPESSTSSLAPAFITNGLLSPITDERSGTSHSSRRSITSTLYSDAASIHEAQIAHVSTVPAARMSTATLVDSVGPQPLSVQPRHVDTGLSQLEGPFIDPNSPVSSIHSPASSLSAPGSRRKSSFESAVSGLTAESLR
nr:hypothetical protein CFP56_25906 [Quercus suber]